MRTIHPPVTPAKAGVQVRRNSRFVANAQVFKDGMPAFAGMTGLGITRFLP